MTTNRRTFLQTAAAAASLSLVDLNRLLAAEGIPQSVQELWADFDPRKDPIEVEVIREWKEDGAVFRLVRYLIGTFKGKPSRMAAIYGFPEGAKEKLPAVMHIHGGGQRAFLPEVKLLVARGYAALSLNWGGSGNGTPPFNSPDGAQSGDPNTDWGAVDPSQLNVPGYSSMLPGPKQFFEDREHPKNNNWYLLTLGCRRGLTFLEQQREVDPQRLGVHGWSMGGNLTMYVAGTDDRVKAAVPGVGGQGWRWQEHEFLGGKVSQDRVKGDIDVFKRTLSFESYSPLIKCPVLHRSGTNDFHGWMDDVYRTNALIKDQPTRYAFSPHLNHRAIPEVEIAMPLKKIYLTGKKASAVPQLDAATAQAIVNDGRGWNNKDRNSFYDALSDEQLLERLRNWSPIVRERAAMALGRRKSTPVAALIDMLMSPSLDARCGACQGLIFLRGRAAPAVDALQNTLADPDLWLRIKAAEALAAIGKPATKTVPQLLELLAQVDTKNDPRGMQQRYLTFALFDRDGMLSRSLDGVDREALYTAVRAGLKNQDGRARGSIGSVYRHLSTDDIKPLLPAIHEAIVQPAPSGEMFADGIRVEGLRLLAQHHIEDGIRALVTYTRDQNPWSSQNRTPELMKILLAYGTHAKAVIPDLEKLAHYFEKEEKDFPKHLGLQKANSVRDTIKAIESSTDTPTLIKLH